MARWVLRPSSSDAARNHPLGNRAVATLVLNHAFLEGLAFAPAETTRGPLVEITQTVLRARRMRGEAILYVHPGLGETDVGGGESFVRWANARVRTPEWGDLLQPLLQLGSGP